MIKLNWQTILLLIGSFALGAFLNYLSTKYANDKLFAQIKAELDNLKLKAGRLTLIEQSKAIALQAKLDLLTKR